MEAPLLLYAALVLVTVLLPGARSRALAAAGLLVSALGIGAERAGGPGSDAAFSTINEVLMGAGALIVVFAAIRARSGLSTAQSRDVRSPSSPMRDPLLVAGLVLAALGPHLILVAAGIFLALLSGAATSLRSRRWRWVVLVALGALLLVAGFYLVFTILGPIGGRMNQLAAGPFSPPAERLLAMLLGLGSLALAGVFPFHRAPWGVALSPVAAILLARILVPALPEGLGDWQAPAMLWLALAVGFSALSGRWATTMAAGGLLGVWSAESAGIAPGLVLLGCGWLTEMLAPARGFGDGGRWSGLWLALPAGLIPFVLGGALRAQVLISVLAVLAATLGLVVESRRRAEAG